MTEQRDFLEEQAAASRIPPDEFQEIYRVLLTARMVGESMQALQREGRVTFHLPSAHDEVAFAGAASALGLGDWVFPGLRTAAVLFQRGMGVEAYVHQVFGTASDPVKGRRLPGFPAWREGRVLPISSSLGASVAQATGMAWAARMRGEKSVVLVLFGEGSTSQPDFHTGLNFAGVYQVPAVFFCRVGGEPDEEAARRRGRAYGIPGVAVDGTDLEAVRATAADAVHRAREGQGPTFIRAAVPSRRERPEDPLEEVRLQMEKRGDWSAEQERALRRAIGECIEAAVAEAAGSPAPPPGSLFDDVFAALPDHLWTQKEELLQGFGEDRFAPRYRRET